MFRIGRWQVAAPAVLAPMAGVTDRPFRVLARRLGAGLAASEMITSDVRLWNSRKSRQRMNHDGEPEPRVVQLAGAEPEPLAEAARRNVDLGAQVIDINMGCPAKKVCNRLCGSALLQDEPLVARLLEAVVAAVAPAGVPVTLKTRTGWDREHRNAVRVARIAEASGIAAIALHGRTRMDFYEGEAEYETIREVKSAVRIPVIANGDVDSPRKAREVLDFTGADGVMLGRAAHGAPWIFRDVNGLLTEGRTPPPLSRPEVRDIVLAHLESIYAFHGEDSGLRIARKHLGWYSELLGHEAREARRSMMAADSTSAQFACTREQLQGWVGAAA
ncbi:MAG: tRNA dihydrouridine synthase DusB [Steroidobacteraceae bacterium]|jgi:tRNA-dihydrouridine synthase B|nr:tRNA dihydrouridine synthase DusB [Steroidobacteraceae bacterium]